MVLVHYLYYKSMVWESAKHCTPTKCMHELIENFKVLMVCSNTAYTWKFECYLNGSCKSRNNHKKATKFHGNAVDQDDENKMSKHNNPKINFQDSFSSMVNFTARKWMSLFSGEVNDFSIGMTGQVKNWSILEVNKCLFIELVSYFISNWRMLLILQRYAFQSN